jgi:hypothetical protein
MRLRLAVPVNQGRATQGDAFETPSRRAERNLANPKEGTRLNTAWLAFMASVSVALAGACGGTGDVASPREGDGGWRDGGRGVVPRGGSGTIGSSSGISNPVATDADVAASSGGIGAGSDAASGSDTGSSGGSGSGTGSSSSGITPDAGTGSSGSGPSPMPIPCGGPMLCSTTCCFEPADGGRRGFGSYSCLVGACPAGAERLCVTDSDCAVGETCVGGGRRAGGLRTCVASPDGGPLDAGSGGG